GFTDMSVLADVVSSIAARAKLDPTGVLASQRAGTPVGSNFARQVCLLVNGLELNMLVFIRALLVAVLWHLRKIGWHRTNCIGGHKWLLLAMVRRSSMFGGSKTNGMLTTS